MDMLSERERAMVASCRWRSWDGYDVLTEAEWRELQDILNQNPSRARVEDLLAAACLLAEKYDKIAGGQK